jgi:uncharacterized protein (TIGR03437 family)
MKNRIGFIASLCALFLLTSTVRAEALTMIVRLTPEAVVPPPATPPTGLSVVTAIIIDVNRDASGNVIAGKAYFDINLLTTTEVVEVTGIDLREGTENANGPIRIDPGHSGGRYEPDIPVTITIGGVSVDPGLLQRILANPYGFYIDFRTSANPDGALRAQLNKFIGVDPPVIHLSDTTFLTAGNSIPTRVELFVSGFDSANFKDFDRINAVMINGQSTPYSSFILTSIGDLAVNLGSVNLSIPSEMRANGGILPIQIRNSQGMLSKPFTIVVAREDKLNSTPVTTVDAAKFGNLVSPESIVAAFGSRLASRAVPAPSLPLPTELDGATVYVNGVAAGLFYVSAGQANYAVPSGAHLGSADVVVVAKDGTVSRGKVNVAGSIPAIFTGKSDGAGAPAAVASRDGQNFDILLSNADGSPVPIDAGNYVALFGTGVRFSSTPMKITIGGIDIDPLYFGPQGSLEGTDQVNLQIPQSLAGKGDLDLVLTLDGKTSNTVKLRIK